MICIRSPNNQARVYFCACISICNIRKISRIFIVS